MDPPLCSSRACLHTAFIASSVHCVLDWPANVPLADCASPVPPWLGQETRASWFRALTPGHAFLQPGLRRGVRAVRGGGGSNGVSRAPFPDPGSRYPHLLGQKTCGRSCKELLQDCIVEAVQQMRTGGGRGGSPRDNFAADKFAGGNFRCPGTPRSSKCHMPARLQNKTQDMHQTKTPKFQHIATTLSQSCLFCEGPSAPTNAPEPTVSCADAWLFSEDTSPAAVAKYGTVPPKFPHLS